MNEQAVIEGPLKGYAFPTVGPVANQPVTSWLSPQLKSGTQFAYNPTQAKSLLTSHGWNVAPGGTTTCTNASLCGSGISAGTALPVEWQPNAPYQITEVAGNLKGVLPQEPTLNITPEDWYFVN